MKFSIPFDPADVQRFNSEVFRIPTTGCAVYRRGRFHAQGTTVSPQIFVWMLAHNCAVPAANRVYATCPTPGCVDPNHLVSEPDRRNSVVALQERFSAKVDRRGECHIFDGTVDSEGYGVLGWRGKNRKAHHVAWLLEKGAWPMVARGKVMICHNCNNRRCVNPAHLRLDTVQGNTDDRVRSGRGAKGATHGSRTKPESIGQGEKNGRAKLTERNVVQIRRTEAQYRGEYGLLSSLEDYFDVTAKTLTDIIARELWPLIPEDAYPEIEPLPRELIFSKKKTGEDAPCARFTDRQIQEMRFLVRQAKGRYGSLKRLQQRYQISESHLKRILNKEVRPDLPDDFDGSELLTSLFTT